MKPLLKILLAVIALAGFSACHSPLSHITYYLDYKEASQGKLFISEANSVSFEYEPLGSILVEEVPGTVNIIVPVPEKTNQKDDDGLYSANPTKTITTYSDATAQSALNYAAVRAIEMGGDGLINLRMSSYVDRYKRKVVQVTGMVIKRK